LHKTAAEKAQALRSKGRKKTAEKRRANAAEKKREAELAAAAAAEAEEAAIRAEDVVTGVREPEENPEEHQETDRDPGNSAALGSDSDSARSDSESDSGLVGDDEEYVPTAAVRNTRPRKRKRH
jgi:hypothetical protein